MKETDILKNLMESMKRIEEGDVVDFPDDTPSSAMNPAGPSEFVKAMGGDTPKTNIKPHLFKSILYYIVDQMTWRSSEHGNTLVQSQFEYVNDFPFTPENVKKFGEWVHGPEGKRAMFKLLSSDENYGDTGGFCDDWNDPESRKECVEDEMYNWYGEGGLFYKEWWDEEIEKAAKLQGAGNPEPTPKKPNHLKVVK